MTAERASATRTLEQPPGILPLYLRAAAPMIPGASALPFVPGGGGEIPEIELRLDGVRAETADVAAYAKVCGFGLRDNLPPTYPHILAFPLHMAVMADGEFPFGAVGLVHLENEIVQHRPIAIGEELSLRVRPTGLEPHPKGRTFSLLTEAIADGETAWESTSTMLRRGGGSDGAAKDDGGSDGAAKDDGGSDGAAKDDGAEDFDGVPEEAPASAEWRLGDDLGRRYGSVSGDRNPIHMHALTAKPLGFPRAIAHGMWTKARCLAALESQLPGSFRARVRFKRPILLPATVEFAERGEGAQIDFTVRDARKKTPHLDGRTEPVEAKTQSRRKQTK